MDIENFVRGIVENPFQGTPRLPRRGKWNFWVSALIRNRISVDLKTESRHQTVRFIVDEHDHVHFTTPEGVNFESFYDVLNSIGVQFENYEDYPEQCSPYN